MNQTSATPSPTTSTPSTDGTAPRIAVVSSSWHADIVGQARSALLREFGRSHAPPRVHTFEVPGAFELPYAAKLCAESGRFAGIANLGVVIRGETSHYDHVCTEVAAGTQRVQLDTGVPVAFGVITAENKDQAEARSGGGKRDQGRNAAIAVARMRLMALALENG